jgi:hypothetical protein
MTHLCLNAKLSGGSEAHRGEGALASGGPCELFSSGYGKHGCEEGSSLIVLKSSCSAV